MFSLLTKIIPATHNYDRNYILLILDRHRPKGWIKNEYELRLQINFCAGFGERVKESEAQWYSIKPLEPDMPSLTDVLGVLAADLLLLLLVVKPGLGKVVTSFQNSKLFNNCATQTNAQ